MKYARAFGLCAITAICIGTASPTLGKGGPILIQGQGDVVSRHISYADLNLAFPPAERTLVNRVHYAVGDLCMEVNGGVEGTWMSRGMVAACSRNIWNAQARPQIEQAIQRAREMASTGKSAIVAAALTISVPADR